ncbi:MAG: serine--tRNA ligase [Anaerolineae bacterium]|jgi:seryl-tRNA synthetase
MLDIRRVRDEPEAVKAALGTRNAEAEVIDQLLTVDRRWREVLTELEELRAKRNRVSKEIGRMNDPADREPLIAQMRVVADQISELEDELRQVETHREDLLLSIPNLPHRSVPVGPDESHNPVVQEWGELPKLDFEPVPHWILGPELGIVDFERGVKLAGSRFYVLLKAGALLERALIAWMLDIHVREHGYTEAYLPFVVKEEVLLGAGQLPKFEDNLYHDVEDDIWLVPTAEVPLTNLHREEILPPDALPLRYVAYTPCFRREKMSAGRDVRGIKRGHQFDKVEMYQFTTPEVSYEALEEMLEHALVICRRLEIPHRVREICTGDLGFTVAKTYDIEMWAPGCEEWLEVSSLSNCEDFQARRANVRFRPERGAKPHFVHTLNGSGLALPRVMIAILESYQRADGSVVVPEVLRAWTGGLEVIT